MPQRPGAIWAGSPRRRSGSWSSRWCAPIWAGCAWSRRGNVRVLVTGAHGFVGRHLTAALRAGGHEVFEADRAAHGDALAIDVTDPLAVRAAFDLARPDAVAHLAAQASVPE